MRKTLDRQCRTPRGFVYVIPHVSRVVKRQLNSTASAASSAGGESGRGEGQPAILGAGIFGIVAETLRYPQPTKRERVSPNAGELEDGHEA